VSAPRRISAHDTAFDYLFLPGLFVVLIVAAAVAVGRLVKPIGFQLVPPHPIVKELRAAVAAAKRS
jgi:hypothetical protein